MYCGGMHIVEVCIVKQGSFVGNSKDFAKSSETCLLKFNMKTPKKIINSIARGTQFAFMYYVDMTFTLINKEAIKVL